MRRFSNVRDRVERDTANRKNENKVRSLMATLFLLTGTYDKSSSNHAPCVSHRDGHPRLVTKEIKLHLKLHWALGKYTSFPLHFKQQFKLCFFLFEFHCNYAELCSANISKKIKNSSNYVSGWPLKLNRAVWTLVKNFILLINQRAEKAGHQTVMLHQKAAHLDGHSNLFFFFTSLKQNGPLTNDQE